MRPKFINKKIMSAIFQLEQNYTGKSIIFDVAPGMSDLLPSQLEPLSSPAEPSGRFQVTHLDFTVTYLRVRELAREATPCSPEAEHYVSAFGRVLETAEHDRQKNSRYVYREAAQGLCVFLRPETPARIAAEAMRVLVRCCSGGTVGVRLAVSKVLGELDMVLPVAPRALLGSAAGTPTPPEPDVAPIGLDTLLDRHAHPETAPDATRHTPGHWLGRTLVCPSRRPETLLAVKFLRQNEHPDCLRRESAWMTTLAGLRHHFQGRFALPAPVDGCPPHIQRLRLPESWQTASGCPLNLHEDGWALAYFAPHDYFSYPNDDLPGRLPAPDDFQEIMGRNARHLGRLMALGLTHEAPIPLFHNRVQQGRRRDAGVYQWHRMGRLDQWLASCRHPNFGASGLRDFEHIEPHQRQGTGLYHAMGTVLLSLFLVTGSYFRAREPQRVGLNKDKGPVDARDLFDPVLLGSTMQTILDQFYWGFTGHDMPFRPDFDLSKLCSRMIEEMGMDTHMSEELRRDDQEEMTDEEFVEFLRGRGFSEETIATMQRGREDVSILTGPHLGGFNRSISLPELVEFTASCVGLAALGRHVAHMVPHILRPAQENSCGVR